MSYLYLKALHIIFVVTWFSGMFYLCRLYVYNREANDRAEPERSILQSQYGIMIKRLLFGITWPSAILTLVFGLWLLFYYWPAPIWLHIKLGLVILLFVYHYSLHLLYRRQKQRNFKYSSTQLRIWNEVPTLFLVSIVMLAVVKENMSVVYGVIGVLLVAMLLMSAIKIYAHLRKAK